MKTVDLSKNYTGSYIENQGIEYEILETASIDFGNNEQCSYGKKTSSTKVWRANKGDEVITYHNGTEETRYKADGEEVIFCNELPGGRLDVYVPRNKDGKPNRHIAKVIF
jgi:hypothetical protein